MTEKPESLFHNKNEKIELENITNKEIKPIVPEENGTTIILQRNAKDDRSKESSDIGALEEESSKEAILNAENFFNEIFEKVEEKDRDKIDIMVIASDTTLNTPDGLKSEHKRAVETADLVITGLKKSMETFSVSEKQFLNSSGGQEGRAIEMSGLKDLSILEESLEFVKFMIEKYGTDVEFWNAYEADTEKETRIKMGAEGPEEIANRIQYFLSLQSQIAEEYHKNNSDRRLIIWAVSHYDAISPFIKKHIAGMDMKKYLPINHGAGITISINKEGKASCDLGDKKLTLN